MIQDIISSFKISLYSSSLISFSYSTLEYIPLVLRVITNEIRAVLINLILLVGIFSKESKVCATGSEHFNWRTDLND